MKRIPILILCALTLSSCIIPLDPSSQPLHCITFEEVSQPYLDARGYPEEETRYTSADYSSIDWWWWTQGFEASFVDSTYDDVYGWAVGSTYEFDPIP